MKKIKKLLALLIFIFGLAFTADIFYPGTLEIIKSSKLTGPVIAHFENLIAKGGKNIKNVLGAKIGKGEIDKEKAVDQINIVSSQILESEAGKKAKEQFDQVITSVIGEVQHLPEQQMSKIRGEIKKQICEDWMKEY